MGAAATEMSEPYQNDSGSKRVLMVRLGSLGDIVHSLPALAALKESFPFWEIDWLVEQRWRALLEGNPCLSNVIDFDTLRWRRKMLLPETWREFGDSLGRLRCRHYDCALDLQGALKSAVACWASGARQVIGFDRPWLREPGASVFYSRRVVSAADAIGVAGSRHVVEANLALAAALGARPAVVKFPLPDGDLRAVPRDIADALASREIVMVNPGAGWRAKEWPPERYGAVCEALASDYGLTTVINCGPTETALAEPVRAACRAAPPLTYSGSLDGLIALLRRTRLVIGPDTGPLHLAAALGVPTVALYGPTDPLRNGPRGNRTRNLRPENAATSHSHKAESSETMKRIEPGQVLQAARELLEETGGRTPREQLAATASPHSSS
jgi:lipopolysaccharide heptosyltransferase I